MNQLRLSQLREELARATAPYRLRASLSKILSEAPIPLQPCNTHLMPTRALATDLLQEMHLCSPNIEGGDDV
jgi:hypothetical protein